MQVITSWTGGQADALRQALRMTNESFAEYLGVAAHTVAYWRKNPEMTPTPKIQETTPSPPPPRRVIRNSPAQAFADLHLIVSKVLIPAQHA